MLVFQRKITIKWIFLELPFGKTANTLFLVHRTPTSIKDKILRLRLTRLGLVTCTLWISLCGIGSKVVSCGHEVVTKI
jgi:hypothetical protein